MDSHVLPSFRKCFDRLPETIQRQTIAAFNLWRTHPEHPSMCFKKVDAVKDIFSVRITANYRALGRLRNGAMYWFWVGPHAEYDGLLKRLCTLLSGVILFQRNSYFATRVNIRTRSSPTPHANPPPLRLRRPRRLPHDAARRDAGSRNARRPARRAGTADTRVRRASSRSTGVHGG
jgi:hypothetical protein